MTDKSRTAVVTGGAQGIGRILADTLIAEDYQVAVWDSDEEALAEETSRQGTHPGWIDVSAVGKKSKARQELLSAADHLQHPAGRVGNAADIARMVLFLCEPENSFITGQNFIIDGGMTRKMIYV
jgi:NAD(P)-dependent dehydrogenase (short-subunit alcohol dehydrogenase family)